MYGYIYKTTNIETNRFYVGRHSNAYVRKNQCIDPRYFGSGIVIREIKKKYGVSNLRCEIVEWCETEEELNDREIYWVNYYKDKFPDECYNIGEGGVGGNNIKYKSEDEKKKILEKISKSVSEYYKTDESAEKMKELLSRPEYHQHLSEGVKKARENPNSKYHTEECRNKKSEVIKKLHEDPNSKYNTKEYRELQRSISRERWERKSEEERETFSETKRQNAIRRWSDPEFKNKVRHPHAKKVIIHAESEDIVFKTQLECNEKLHIDVKYAISHGGVVRSGKYIGCRIEIVEEGGDVE